MRFSLPFFFFCAFALAAPAAVRAQDDAPKKPKPGPARKRTMFAKADPDCPSVLNVTKNTDEESEISGSYTKICYRSPAELLVELNEYRKMNAWADSTYQRKLAALPAGGVLVLTIRRQGQKNADPSYLTLTGRTKDGQEVYKQTPPAATGRFWGRDLYQVVQTLPFVKTTSTDPVLLSVEDVRLRQTFEYEVKVPQQ